MKFAQKRSGNMERHPIKTLKGLLSMGASELSLTSEEAQKLIDQFEELFDLADYMHDEECHTLDKIKYGMDE